MVAQNFKGSSIVTQLKIGIDNSITSMTVLIAAQATGPPPNVVPSVPAFSVVAILFGMRTAPQGNPPPNPLATVSRSGRTPYSCAPNGAPSLPIPVCTSSRISRAP